MKKVLFFAAVAIGAFASCADDEVVSISSPPETSITTPDPETPGAIMFSSASKGITRADIVGADAALKLRNAFVVSGYKGSRTDTPGSIVFDNYLVKWDKNTANTTASNTTNWEYVGIDPIKHATDNGITSQKIKYWDYSVDQYDFIAWSTGSKDAVYNESELTDGKVYVSAITPDDATSKAYTFTGKAADLSECYIADLVTVNKLASPAPGYGEVAPYGQVVSLKFRQLGTKVRIGIYETVPGYSVKDVKFYSAAAVKLVEAGDAKPGSGTYSADEAKEANESAKIFTTAANEIYTEGTYTVFFPTVDTPTDADNNQAHVSFLGSGAQSTVVEWGGLNYTIAEEGEKTPGNVFLGRTSNTASFAGDADDNYYVIYLPNQSGTNLNLRVNYTLESTDGSGEVINVKGATAQVPSIYTQWKPGFAYTYLFKISDKTNGYTGNYDPLYPDDVTVNSDPAGLYPITFDAVVVDAEEGNNTQETITLVSTPSITTYQEGSNVVNNNEYTPGNNIYVTVSDGNSETTPDLANSKLVKLEGKVALYTLSEDKSEAEVIDALQMQDDDPGSYTIKGRSGLGLTAETFALGSKIRYGVDGNIINAGNMRVLNFAPAAGKTYAFVYTKTAADPDNDVVKYQAVSFSDANVATKYRYDYKAAIRSYYNDNGTAENTADDIEFFDAQKGVKYFAVDAGVYTMQTPFIGQGVGNLYLDAAGNTIASGYAKSEVTYYYTDDNGMTYKAATNIAYEAFETTTLYKDRALSTSKTETAPADGQAYYDANGKYCVILPQQTKDWYELDTTKYVVATETTAVDGQTYFDKYTKNDGVYYTKIIKVQ